MDINTTGRLSTSEIIAVCGGGYSDDAKAEMEAEPVTDLKNTGGKDKIGAGLRRGFEAAITRDRSNVSGEEPRKVHARLDTCIQRELDVARRSAPEARDTYTQAITLSEDPAAHEFLHARAEAFD